jgi:2-keto-4-pentenoate hydratase/2-oxohepta-3-ene-1,7-dioic acid hydratase in catechol pathway
MLGFDLLPETPLAVYMQCMIIFTKAPQSVIGRGSTIKYPHELSEHVDYELGVPHPSC